MFILFRDFSAFVVPAVLTGKVGHGCTAAVLASGKTGGFQGMMAAPLVATASGLMLLGNSHSDQRKVKS